jgi:glycosyltransferase involved in cell wall biosynthesis
LKKVLISAPLLSSSGYGFHSRQIFEYLLTVPNIELYCDITSWGSSSWKLSEDSLGKIKDKILERFLPESQISCMNFDECYSVSFPNEWKYLGKKNIGLTAGLEGEQIPKDWLYFINKCDSVIVTSIFTKNAIENTFKLENKKLKTSINVVYQFFEMKNNIEKLSIIDSIETKKNILVFGQITNLNYDNDRKNILRSIDSLSRIIANIKDVGIVYKTFIRNNSFKDYLETCQIIQEKISQIKLELGEKTPKIYLIHGNMTDSQVQNLYTHKKISAFVNLSSGEGFGRCLLEASACNLPIIATNYSAYKEFLNDDFLKVEYSIVEKDYNGFKTKCAMYDDYSLNKQIYNFFNNEEYYNNISKLLQEKICRDFSRESIFKSYNLCLT